MPSAAQTTVRILIGAVVAVLFVGIKNYRDLGAPGKRPDLDNNEYWGPALKEPYKENKAVLPYDIGVSAEVSASVLRYLLWQLVGETHSTFCLPKLVCRLVHTLRILIVCVLPLPCARSQLIADLKTQLDRPLKLQEPLEGVGFEYGFNAKELQNLVKYWRDSYLPKWNEREAYLKQFKHFQTEIQG